MQTVGSTMLERQWVHPHHSSPNKKESWNLQWRELSSMVIIIIDRIIIIIVIFYLQMSTSSENSRIMPEDNDMKRNTRPTNTSSNDSSRRPNNKQQKISSPQRKVIRDTVNSVRNKVKAFKKEHLGARSNFDFFACSKCLEEDILPAWRMPADVIFNSDDFLQLTLRKEVSEDIVGSDEYIDLISISKRAQVFDDLVFDSRTRLQRCLKQNVQTSCISLKEMAGEEPSIAVSEYEDRIVQHRKRTEFKIDELKENFKSYKQSSKPFVNFIKDGKEHTSLINHICNNILELCKLIENWVADDDRYPGKLLEELESNKKVRENLKDSLIQIEDKRMNNMQEVQKLRKSEFKAENDYMEHRKEKNKTKARKLELENRREILAEKAQMMRQERDKLKRALAERSIKSPRESSSNLEKLEMLETDIDKLDLEKMKMDEQLKKVDVLLRRATDRAYEQKVEAVTCRHLKEEMVKENKKLELEIQSINERIAIIDANNQVLIRIREMKLTPGLLPKYIKDQQKQKESISGGVQELTDACKLAAPYIGKDWQQVYFNLPFDPPRDVQKRHRDAEVLDNIAARNDVTWNDQALKSLDKWRAFHRHGNVRELIRTLRCVKKKQIAKQLEQKFITA
ncbi:unnamed protein product [Candidula unifasciata]|uniref:Death domain-containing protein n=1 Tax=Candidula unifasciata TaxID=100452 RepID=A0A8S3Z935_9EUPU|nr:unnamed protein product [Candidula unifasciata]